MIPFLISPVIPDIMSGVYLSDNNEDDDDDVWNTEDDALSEASVEHAMVDCTTSEEKIQKRRKKECDKLIDSLSKNEHVEGKKRNTKL